MYRTMGSICDQNLPAPRAYQRLEESELSHLGSEHRRILRGGLRLPTFPMRLPDSLSDIKVTERYAFYNGPAVYMCVTSRKEAPSSLSFDLPDGWKHVVPLDAAPKVNGKPACSAPDCDTLADSPVALGDVTTREFATLGKPHAGVP